MGVNLRKGQKVDLTKSNPGLRNVMVGLGWDPVSQNKWAGTFSQGTKQNIDCDAVAFLLNGDGKLDSREDVVFFNNLIHHSGCVNHMGDNLTGEGEGDDEQIFIRLSGLSQQYQRIVILASIYMATDRRQHFGLIEKAFIRLVDADKHTELCRYNLSESYSGVPAMVFGELYRYNGEWKFGAIGQPLKVWSIAQMASGYGLPVSVWR